MGALRILLVVLWLVIVGYTVVTVTNHGLNFFPAYFGDIAEMGWAGQFNVDFTCFLALMALWVAWRHHFSVGGILLALASPSGGMVLLSSYLLIVIWKDKPNMTELLMGKDRARNAGPSAARSQDFLYGEDGMPE